MNSAGVNALACDATDPFSRQPELKHAAVQIVRADLPFPIAVILRCADQREALEMLQHARQLLDRFSYATVSLYGRDSPLVVFRAAAEVAPDDGAVADLDRHFALEGDAGAIVFADPRRQIAKKAIAVDGRLLGVRLVGETLAQSWLKQAMAEDELDASLIRFALAPSAKPPATLAPRNVICKCADVSDMQIRQELEVGANLPQLQENLKCGTFCGSCVPEIKRTVAEFTERQPAAA